MLCLQQGDNSCKECVFTYHRGFLTHLMLLLDAKLNNLFVGNLMNSIKALLTNSLFISLGKSKSRRQTKILKRSKLQIYEILLCNYINHTLTWRLIDSRASICLFWTYCPSIVTLKTSQFHAHAFLIRTPIVMLQSCMHYLIILWARFVVIDKQSFVIKLGMAMPDIDWFREC